MKQLIPMSGNRGLLDTNVIIDFFSGDEKVVKQVNKLQQVCITSVVLGELYIGINRVINKSKHLKKLNSFLQLCMVLDVDAETAKHFGEIVAELYKKGKPIPTNDVWIAASARQYDLTLITRDKHFEEVAGLSLKYW